MNDSRQILDLLVSTYSTTAPRREAMLYAERIFYALMDAGFTIVRTADLDLAVRKSAHGCTDALCGDCD